MLLKTPAILAALNTLREVVEDERRLHPNLRNADVDVAIVQLTSGQSNVDGLAGPNTLHLATEWITAKWRDREPATATQRDEETIIRAALRRELGAFAMDQPDGSIKIGYTQPPSYRSDYVRLTFADRRLTCVLLERAPRDDEDDTSP